jgi:hypothetical protein
MTPPSPLYCCVLQGAWNCPGFFSEWPRFLPGIGSGWSVFRVPFVGWRCFHLWMYDPPSPFFGGVLGFLLVEGVVDSFGWRIFSYFFVLFSIYLGYGCAVVVRRRQVRIFMDWFFSGSTLPCAKTFIVDARAPPNGSGRFQLFVPVAKWLSLNRSVPYPCA